MKKRKNKTKNENVKKENEGERERVRREEGIADLRLYEFESNKENVIEAAAAGEYVRVCIYKSERERDGKERMRQKGSQSALTDVRLGEAA